jgi:hypothetical protein
MGHHLKGDEMGGKLLRKFKASDRIRESLPGEHWLTLGAGVGVWLLSRHHPSLVVRTLGLLAGTALAGRAASGRDGLGKLLRFTPLGRRRMTRWRTRP